MNEKIIDLAAEIANREDNQSTKEKDLALYTADIWRDELAILAPERLNPSREIKSLNFKRIKNPENKELTKQYVRYLLLNTDQTLKYIRNQLCDVITVLNIVDKPYTEWAAADVEYLTGYLSQKKIKKNTLAQYILSFEAFTEYLLLHEILKDNPIKYLHSMAHYKYEYKTTAPDEYVITQIFNVLRTIKDQSLILRFLLIYCTGMRVSEACAIKKDCLEQTGDNYFVRYYQNKMKKWVTNIIPAALYEMIDEYKKTLSAETKYLFPRFTDQLKPSDADGFVNRMQQELSKANIKNTDGSPYVFTAHSFRHLMAVRMREENIPLQFIQEQLHHESPEMTLAYTEFNDRQKMAKMQQFIDIHGENRPITIDVPLASKKEYAEAVQRFIHAQMLPNGVCTRSVKLPKCSHMNACLKCSNFRTSIEFLDIHEEYLKRMESYIVLADQNGWIMQAADARNTRETLITIINALKGCDI